MQKQNAKHFFTEHQRRQNTPRSIPFSLWAAEAQTFVHHPRPLIPLPTSTLHPSLRGLHCSLSQKYDIFKKKKKSFHGSFACLVDFLLLTFLEAMGCVSGVLVSFTVKESIYLHFHSPHTERRCDPAFSSHLFSFNQDLFFFFPSECFWSDSQTSSEVTDNLHILLRWIPVDWSDTKLKESIHTYFFLTIFRYVNKYLIFILIFSETHSRNTFLILLLTLYMLL